MVAIIVTCRVCFSRRSQNPRRADYAATINNVRQFIPGATLYAGDNQQFLPPADTDNNNKQDTHTPIRPTPPRPTCLLRTGPPVPGLSGTSPNGCRPGPGGGPMTTMESPSDTTTWADTRRHPGFNRSWVTNTWISPAKASDDPSLVLVADLNVLLQLPANPRPALRPGPGGPDDAYFGRTSRSLRTDSAGRRATGGNVGLLDGSVSWKPSGKCGPTVPPNSGKATEPLILVSPLTSDQQLTTSPHPSPCQSIAPGTVFGRPVSERFQRWLPWVFAAVMGPDPVARPDCRPFQRGHAFVFAPEPSSPGGDPGPSRWE